MDYLFKHINEDLTFQTFGYKSTDLLPKSSKKIIVNCIECNNPRQISKSLLLSSKNAAQRCNSCQRKLHIVSVRHDPTGTVHSDKTKLKISESNKKSQKKGCDSLKFGKKISNNHRNKLIECNKNRNWSAESKLKLSKSHTGKKLSIDTRKKMSIARTGVKNHRYGKIGLHGKGQYYKTLKGETIWVRSGWEYKTAEYLDNNNFEWEYEPEFFPITYKISGETKAGTFRPDFKILKNEVEYWEVKGYWRDDAKYKFEAFVSQYPHINVKLLQKNELIALGILSN